MGAWENTLKIWDWNRMVMSLLLALSLTPVTSGGIENKCERFGMVNYI